MSRAQIVGAASLCIIALVHGCFLISTADAEVSHSTPRYKLRRRHSNHPLPQTPANAIANASRTPHHNSRFMPIFDSEQQEYLKAHNDLRQSLGMPPLKWDPKLTSAAHSWGLQRQNDCNYRSHSPSRMNRFGENIFWQQYKEFSPASVVQKWFSEQSLFDHTINRCKCIHETDDCECGHYLNIIWRTTRRVGCSSPVYCTDQKGVLVVCNYEPAGNLAGVDPFNPAGSS